MQDSLSTSSKEVRVKRSDRLDRLDKDKKSYKKVKTQKWEKINQALTQELRKAQGRNIINDSCDCDDSLLN